MKGLAPLVLLLVLLLFGVSALASESEAPALIDLAAFQERKARIESDLAQGDRYREISEYDRRKVLEALERIAAALQGARSIDELTAQQRADVFTDQELVNTVLTDARESSRVVCHREAPVGSRFKRTRCLTVAEWDAIRDNSQRALGRKHRANIHAPAGDG